MFNPNQYGQRSRLSYQSSQIGNQGENVNSGVAGASQAPPAPVNQQEPAGSSQTHPETVAHTASGASLTRTSLPLMAGWTHAIRQEGAEKGQLYYFNTSTGEERPASQRPDISQGSLATNQPENANQPARHSASTAIGSQITASSRGYVFFDMPTKRQSRGADCWYAAMQIMLSWKHGKKTKPSGDAVARHRKTPVIGNRLAFDSHIGAEVMEQNGLRPAGSELDVKDIHSFKNLLQKHGPFMLCGRFHDMGFGHNLVICGVNTEKKLVAYMDVAFGGQAKWSSLKYFNLTHKTPGSDNITEESVLVFK